ncbi:hypothetical protein ACB092_02G171200 [Castanea dentata]
MTALMRQAESQDLTIGIAVCKGLSPQTHREQLWFSLVRTLWLKHKATQNCWVREYTSILHFEKYLGLPQWLEENVKELSHKSKKEFGRNSKIGKLKFFRMPRGRFLLR